MGSSGYEVPTCCAGRSIGEAVALKHRCGSAAAVRRLESQLRTPVQRLCAWAASMVLSPAKLASHQRQYSEEVRELASSRDLQEGLASVVYWGHRIQSTGPISALYHIHYAQAARVFRRYLGEPTAVTSEAAAGPQGPRTQ